MDCGHDGSWGVDEKLKVYDCLGGKGVSIVGLVE